MSNARAKRSFESEPWLTPEEAAEYLKCSTRQVHRRKAELGAVMFGSLPRFKASEIDRRLDLHRLDRAQRR